MEENRVARIAMLAMLPAFCMAFCFYVANAADPPPLQDFCVAVSDLDSAVLVNGKVCKNPTDVKIQDFLYKDFTTPGDTNNVLKAKATLLDITRFPALNTLGVSIARVDFGPFGLNTPHWHPRGSEIFAVMEGNLYAGFVTTDNKLWDTIISKGDVIVFPQALMHFQMNIDNSNSYAIAAFGSQNPGRVDVANTVFGTNPPIVLEDVLTSAFQVNAKEIERLRSQFNESLIDSGRSILKMLSERS